MRKQFHHGRLVFCLFIGLLCPAVVHGKLPKPPKKTAVAEVTLPNGDLADVYFPDIEEKKRDALIDAFPVVAVLQGAQVEKSFYRKLGERLAREGFVAVIPNHRRVVIPGAPAGLFTSRTVITNVLAQMEAEDANPDSPLYQIVDTGSLGLVGHSFGGVVGLFASAAHDVCLGPFVPPFLAPFCDGQYTRPAALRAAVFYGANLVRNGAVLLDLNTTGVAIALMQGTADGLALPTDAELTYLTLEQPRALIMLNGANHYGICDETNPLGAQPDPSEPELKQKEAVGEVGKWISLWLQAQLMDDPKAEEKFDKEKHGAVHIRVD